MSVAIIFKLLSLIDISMKNVQTSSVLYFRLFFIARSRHVTPTESKHPRFFRIPFVKRKLYSNGFFPPENCYFVKKKKTSLDLDTIDLTKLLI